LPALARFEPPPSATAAAAIAAAIAAAARKHLLTFAPFRLTLAHPMSAMASRSAPPAPDPQRAERDAWLASQLVAAAAGDGSAFETFYDATIGYARTLARRMLHGADTDDLLADAYFEVWRNAARFDAARGSAVTWLLTIVRSRSLDLLRHQAAHPSAATAADDETADPDAIDPAERLWCRQAGSRLDAALRQLNATERWVLGLAYFRDMTHSEIAAATRLPLGTVKSSLQRAQAKLRSALAT